MNTNPTFPQPFSSSETNFNEYFFEGEEPFADAHYTNNWQSKLISTLPIEGFIDFDVSNTESFDQLAIWNRSLHEITVLVADNRFGPWDEVADFVLEDKQASIFSYTPQILDLGDEYENEFLRIRVDSTHLNNPTDRFGYAIVGEVAVRASVDVLSDSFDCNGDDVLNAGDLACVSSVLERDIVLDALGSQPGDLDGNGAIDFADFLIVSTNYGADDATYVEGNVDLDGGVGFADFLILSENLTVAATSEAVPEPSEFVKLLLISGVLIVHGSRRRYDRDSK